MEIKRIGRNPAADPQKARASQISVHNNTVYFAASPNRPFDCGVSVARVTPAPHPQGKASPSLRLAATRPRAPESRHYPGPGCSRGH